MNKILKLNVALIASLLSLSLYSCSSDEPTDPTKDDEEEQVKDEPRDWSVTVFEDIWWEEGWIDLTNNSAECKNWKKQYEQYCCSEKPPTETNHWTNIWSNIKYTGLTEASMTKEVERIVSFTRIQSPDIHTSSSIDMFTAILNYGDYSVFYEYYPYQYMKDGDKTGWVLTVENVVEIYDGSTIVIPDEYYSWCREHEKDLTEHKNTDGVIDVYVWTITQNTFTREDIANIVKMVKWSQVEYSKPYSKFTISVEVHEYGTNLTRTW